MTSNTTPITIEVAADLRPVLFRAARDEADRHVVAAQEALVKADAAKGMRPEEMLFGGALGTEETFRAQAEACYLPWLTAMRFGDAMIDSSLDGSDLAMRASWEHRLRSHRLAK